MIDGMRPRAANRRCGRTQIWAQVDFKEFSRANIAKKLQDQSAMFKKSVFAGLASKMISQGLLDREHYLQFCPDLQGASDIEMAEDYVLQGEAQGFSPSSLFDPSYYCLTNPDVREVDSLISHFIENGRREGRPGSLAVQLIANDLDGAAQDQGLIPRVGARPGDADYLSKLDTALRYCDDTREYFSSDFYNRRHPDIAASNVAPLFHYLKHGRFEGRRVNTDLFKQCVHNASAYDPRRPSVLICVHEGSKTGAPLVGLDLGRSLSADYNIVFVSLRDGPILKEAEEEFCAVAVIGQYEAEMSYVMHHLKSRYSFDQAIFSSSACEPLVRWIVALDCHVTCLVHEFWEYMFPARNVVFLSDVLVFSSKELLKSWNEILLDVQRPPDSVMVLPQPASASGSRQLSKLDARRRIEEVTGLNLAGATLVLGAGQVQIRKGTDIFIQVANQLVHQPRNYVCVWIGEPISEFELNYGVWLHAQIERSKNENGELAVHFEPAGPLYQVLMDAADVFLVTSRLDPLPNVALDAAARNLPVIAFRRATGLADLAEAGQIDLTEVGYAAVDEVVAAIQRKVPQSGNVGDVQPAL